MSMAKRKIYNFLKNILIILSATIVGLIFCEVILHVAGISYPVFNTYDELRGVALKPNKSGLYRHEGEGYLRINSLGYRDVEHAIEKSPKTFRIAVLGDSYAEARQVALEDTFWSYLQQHLNTCPALTDKHVEVLNFGIGGYGTTQELLTLQHHIWQFSPDMVLLTVTTGNDLTENSKELSSNGEWRSDFRPFHELRNGELVLDNSFRKIGLKFLVRYFLYEGIHHLRFLELVNHARHAWETRKLKQQMKDAEVIEIGLNDNIYAPPKTAVWENAWLITEKLFSQINKEVKEQGAIFILATLTSSVQVHPDSAKRERLQKKHNIKNLFYPEYRISSMGERNGFPVIIMAEKLQQIATHEGIFLHGFKNTAMGVGHWNETGHRLAGEILVKEICAKVLTKAVQF